MCTSAEVLTTQHFPNLDGNPTAWVIPTFRPMASGTSSNLALDASGLVAIPGDMSCNGWKLGNQSLGLPVDATGRFTLESCTVPHRIACCAGQPELLGDIDRDGDLDLADSALIRRFLGG